MAATYAFRQKHGEGCVYISFGDDDKVKTVVFGKLTTLHPRRREALRSAIFKWGGKKEAIETLLVAYELVDVFESDQFELPISL